MQGTAAANFGQQWWRVGGLLGIGFVVLFLVGVVVLIGDSPMRGDSVAEIREYYADHGERYLTGDFLTGIAFIFGFLPFVVILARVLDTGPGWPAILARLVLVAGIILTAIGGASGMALGGLAISGGSADIDDGAVRALSEIGAYAFANVMLTMALFQVATGLAIWMSRALTWRWLGILGIVVGLALVVGSAWPIDGDDEGPLAIIGFIALAAGMLFILLTSIHLVLWRGSAMAAAPAAPGMMEMEPR